MFENLKYLIIELYYRLKGINRAFYCSSEIETERQCKFECKHCREYFKPLNNERYGDKYK